jgi:uncharacterized protein YjbJ (UPF0337 family)
MGDRMQRARGKAKETKGTIKKNIGIETGRPGTEARGIEEQLEGKAEKTVGKARSALKKSTR